MSDPTAENQTDGSTETSEQDAVAEPLRWTVRLSDRSPKKIWGVLVALVGAGAIGWLLFQHPLPALVGMLAVFASVGDYLLPIHCKIDSVGATSRCGLSVTAIEWSEVKRVVVDADGVKCSPLPEAGRMDPFRGVYLRFSNNRESVTETVRQFWRGDVRFLEG